MGKFETVSSQVEAPSLKKSRRFEGERRVTPFDNAKAESFMKTLKAEEAHATAYVDLDRALPQHSLFRRRHPQGPLACEDRKVTQKPHTASAS
jgi:hypothetical protein